MAMLLLDLDDLPAALDGRGLSSTRRIAPLWFRDRDYLPGRDRPLADAVRDLVAERTGHRPEGPVRLLTHVRTWGFVFNPASFYYCFDPSGDRVEAVVTEITNTPWKERHCYVVRPQEGSERGSWHELQKEFHVSPFMDMEQRYRWFFTPPADELLVHMENFEDSDRLFDATLRLSRRPLTNRGLARLLARYPLLTLRVVADIHWQALRLWLKRVPFHSHPSKRVPAVRSGS
jgi:DUF1365 family protein